MARSSFYLHVLALAMILLSINSQEAPVGSSEETTGNKEMQQPQQEADKHGLLGIGWGGWGPYGGWGYGVPYGRGGYGYGYGPGSGVGYGPYGYGPGYYGGGYGYGFYDRPNLRGSTVSRDVVPQEEKAHAAVANNG